MDHFRAASYSPCTTASSSPLSNPPSSISSPAFSITPLAPASTMVHRSNSRSSSRSIGSTGSHNSPRMQTAGKGGCWTCRLRRKKCDELRENGSCHTCNRLNIKCLGWGNKRPEWMRNKQCVDAYKAEIKAQLTRAGLIRGQPRTAAARLQGASIFSPTYHVPAMAGSRLNGSPVVNGRNMESNIHNPDSRVDQHGHQLNALETPSSEYCLQLSVASHSEPNLNALSLDFSSPFQMSPLSSVPISLPQDHSNFSYDFTSFSTSPSLPDVPLDFRQLSTDIMTITPTSQTPMQANHVLYYFENVAKCCSAFGSDEPTNITYSLILQDPQGPVSNAICAVACLHQARARGGKSAQIHEPAKHYYDEACHQINSKRMREPMSESDAFAALHLISYSVLSGGERPWQWLFEILLDWASQMGILVDENPAITFSRLSEATRCALKLTMWIDTFSSVTNRVVPKTLLLFRRIFHQQGNRRDSRDTGAASVRLRMDLLTGCPDDCMMAIAEISTLMHWKWIEQQNGSLSIRELVRRVDNINHQYRNGSQPQLDLTQRQPLSHSSTTATPLESQPFLIPQVQQDSPSTIYREFVEMLLQVALSGWKRFVPEISRSIERMFSLLSVFPLDGNVSINLPLLVTGSMLDDLSQRNFIRKKLLGDCVSVGNGLSALLVLESLWHQRQKGVLDCTSDSFAAQLCTSLII